MELLGSQCLTQDTCHKEGVAYKAKLSGPTLAIGLDGPFQPNQSMLPYNSMPTPFICELPAAGAQCCSAVGKPMQAA
jgi:hypothetical protein